MSGPTPQIFNLVWSEGPMHHSQAPSSYQDGQKGKYNADRAVGCLTQAKTKPDSHIRVHICVCREKRGIEEEK